MGEILLSAAFSDAIEKGDESRNQRRGPQRGTCGKAFVIGDIELELGFVEGSFVRVGHIVDRS